MGLKKADVPGLAEQLERYGYEGLTNRMIHALLGVGERTLYDWLERYPQLSQSLQAGRARRAQQILHVYMEQVSKGDMELGDRWLRLYFADWRDPDSLARLADGASRVAIREIVVEHPHGDKETE